MSRTALLSRHEVHPVLAPYLPLFASAYDNAMESWRVSQRTYTQAPTDLSGSTRANWVFDVLTSDIERALVADPNARVTRKGRTFYVTVNNKVCVRFKKFRGPKLGTSSTPTRRATAWAQQVLLEQEDSGRPTLVVAGYLLDASGLDFERLAVTCRLDGMDVWEPLDFLGIADSSSIVPLGSAPSAPSGPVVSPAKGASRRNVEGGGQR